MAIENLFISCGSNTVENGIIYMKNILEDNIIIGYTSSNMIALVNFYEKRLEYTLIGHIGKVINLTSYYNPIENYTEIISSGEDGVIIVWRHYKGDSLQKWIIQEKLQNLQGDSITSHSSLYTNIGIFITASTSKSKLVTWFRSLSDKQNNFNTHEEFQYPSAQMPKTITLMNCPIRNDDNNDTNNNNNNNNNNNKIPSVILAVGSVDSRVHLRLYNILQLKNENNLIIFSKSTPIGILTGHEDWVTCLSEPLYIPNKSIENSYDLFLASGSQDSKIRIWKITPTTIISESDNQSNSEQNQQQNLVIEEHDDVNEDDDNDNDEQEEGEEDTNREVKIGVVSEENTGEARCAFTAAQFNDISSSSLSLSNIILYSVTLETLLVGHEDWVTSLHWMSSNIESKDESLRLFSTSMDRNMVIWSPDPSDGIWVPSIRMGDIGGNLGGSVGGNLLGFVGGCTFITKNNADSRKYNNYLIESILGIGYGGSFHLWQRVLCNNDANSNNDNNNNNQNDLIHNIWSPKSFLTGHFAPISDVIWSNCPGDENSPSNNEFIMTVSVDQTCRLFAPICNHPSSNIRQVWCELSRPQIHGYDLSSIQLLPFHSTPFSFFSAGDEKAIRSFEAPWIVLEGLSILAGNTAAKQLLQGDDGSNKRVQSAYIPELGLSNRASNLMTGDELKEQDSRGVDAVEWNNPPLEGQLADKTIWPEIHKLHGHKSDVVCLSASNCGNWLATAAKGRDTKSSAILIWEMKRMVCLTSLLGHESTVTSLSFSPNSRYLISGGKDRSILLHECFHLDESNPSTKNHQHSFTPRAFLKNAHKRIIWDLTWIGENGDYFATASRDGSVKVWKVDQISSTSSTTIVQVLTFNPFDGVAVTSIDSTKQEVTFNSTKGWFLLIGAESGKMQIWFLSTISNESTISHVYSVPDFHCHGATVRKLKWKESEKQSELKFASCSDDHSVRIFRFVW